MGTIYRNGEMYGSNTSIDDTKTSDKSTWSSEKISGEVDDRIAENKTIIKSVRYTIPAGTGTNTFAYPAGFNKDNCILICEKILTRYGSWVDGMYDNGSYWGDMSFQNGHFNYSPNNNGYATEIIFTFLQIIR